MMDRMMDNMSTADKLEMMERMMPKVMEDMTPEDMEAMMSKMMPLMMKSLSRDSAPGETPEPDEED